MTLGECRLSNGRDGSSVYHDDGIAGKGAKVKQRTAVKRSSEGERDKEKRTRRGSAQRLEVVPLQEPERGLGRLVLVDLWQALEQAYGMWTRVQ